MMHKIARYAYRAIFVGGIGLNCIPSTGATTFLKIKKSNNPCEVSGFLGFVDGVGRNSNRLPHDFEVKTINGGNESRRNYLLSMIILAANFVK
jgi:hypothetical protein